jgi:hypothetical protein
LVMQKWPARSPASVKSARYVLPRAQSTLVLDRSPALPLLFLQVAKPDGI